MKSLTYTKSYRYESKQWCNHPSAFGVRLTRIIRIIKYFDLSANFDFPLFVISGIPDAVINLPVHFIFKFGRIRITVGTIAVDICGFFDTGYSADGFAGTSLFFRIPDTIINAPKPINPAAIKMLLNVIKITPLYYAVIVFNTETVTFSCQYYHTTITRKIICDSRIVIDSFRNSMES